MLLELYPRVHRRFTSLPILGPILDGYVVWLHTQGYSRVRLRQHCRNARRLTRLFQKRGIHTLQALTRERLGACAPADSQDDPERAVVVRMLGRYFEAETSQFPPRPLSRIDQRVATYTTYLESVRGFAPSTIAFHRSTVAELLAHLRYEAHPTCLAALTAQDIEAFVGVIGPRLARVSLQHVVAHLRAFLRFLASAGEAPTGLDVQIDTPRVYLGEQLPRALPWATVRGLLDAIDRTRPGGVRDYAIFLLITTYGLRASEVVGLTLDDVEWRAGRLRILQRKTGRWLWLPLTDAVGVALLEYLRVRPGLTCRAVFLRRRTPAGPLKPTAITEVFQRWSKASGLRIPFQGVHCLRHSYAVYLLRMGTSLKTIGDLLGHRSLDSTCVYLRLAVEDLRDVALPLPSDHARRDTGEVTS